MKAARAETPSRTRIVLAEDDNATRRRLTQVLTGSGYEVTSAASAREALAVIKRAEPDLVILDLQMPEGSGFEVLERLREASDSPGVVVMTGRDNTADIPRALELGATEYVIKPIDRVDFKERVNRALAGSPRWTARSTVPVRVILQELHDPGTGRISADKVAEYLAVPLKQLAEAIGVKYSTVHKTPAAEPLQGGLIPIKRSLEILQELIRNPVGVRAWLNTPHPDLGMRTPLRVILEGNAEALRTILENALEGIPS
jgi:CheY-like chemotaxis protein